jgi:superfamily II DNA/RNA helicase
MRVALQEIQRGCDILISTPGRIRHFIFAKFVFLKLIFKKFFYFFLD